MKSYIELEKIHFYASEPFVLYKTISYVVNKNAIPKDIQKRLNLK